MNTINQITQTHLSVFVFDKTNNNPITRMPMYAEIAVIGKRIREVIDANNINIISDTFQDRDAKAWMVEALEKYFSASYFNHLGNEERNNLIQTLIDKTAGEIQSLPNATKAKKKAIVDETVKKIAIELNIPAPEPQPEFETLSAFPLGMLATDHVGYLSYSLTNVPKNPFPMYNNLQFAVYLYPMGKEGARIDALQQARITPDVILAKLEIEKPVFEASLKALNLPAMQNPDLADWYMSPGSFAALPSALIGTDGCENLFPANFATQEFRFRQVIRLREKPFGYEYIPNEYKFGYVDEYKVSLIPIGHSLGEIKYSLPLAPGESVKLAIIDWSRIDSSVRTEDTKFAEKLMHDTHRDRSITETVQSALNEWQRGGNVQGGANVSLFGIISIGGGGGYSTSTGSRDLAASSVQKLSDSFSQASSALREFHSTVVVQSKQEEKENIQTRTFTNYNHSHTLTILYYEILRHFRVATEWVNRKPVILKKYREIDFKIYSNIDSYIALLENIGKFRHLIEPILLNQSVRSGFDAMEKMLSFAEKYRIEGWDKDRDTFLPTQGEIEFKFFELGLKTGVGFGQNIPATAIEAVGTDILTPGGTLNGIDGFLVLRNGDYLQFSHDPNSLNSGRFNLNYDKRLYNHNFLSWRIVSVGRKIKWSEIAGVVLRNFDGQDAWVCEYIKLHGISDNGIFTLIDGIKIDALLTPQSSHSITGIVAPTPNNLTVLKLEKNLTSEEVFSIRKLSQHLVEFTGYYHREIYLHKDYNNTAKEFELLNWPPNNDTLIDHAEPFALEVFGDYVAYPLIEDNKLTSDKLKQIYDAIKSDDPARHEWAIKEMQHLHDKDFELVITKSTQAKAKTEKLISLPTRGVFAEGKLGHCNISEEIDDTRFWKWEEHPIPIQAPDINPINAVTPQPVQQIVQPSQLPNSSINIVSPAAAPDPQGLAEALKVLATPNIFRDMSGRQEVAELLKSLANETVSMAEAKNKAQEIQAKYGKDLAGGAGSNNSNTKNPSSSEAVKNVQQLGEANKNLVGYASPSIIKQNANKISDSYSDLAELVKKQQAQELDERIAMNGNNIIAAISENETGADLDPRRIPKEIMDLLDLYSGTSYAKGSIPQVVTAYMRKQMEDVWSGNGGIIGIMFYGDSKNLNEYLDKAVPNTFSSVIAKAKSRFSLADNGAFADTSNFEDSNKHYCICRFKKEDGASYFARMAHEICHFILAPSTVLIEQDVRNDFFHADLVDKVKGAKGRSQFMGEILGRRLNFLFHEATDGDLVDSKDIKTNAKGTNPKTIGKSCFDWATNPGLKYSEVKEVIQTLLPNKVKQRVQIGIWLQNFWTKNILFDDTVFDKKIKDEFNAAGHFLITATDSEFDAITGKGIQ